MFLKLVNEEPEPSKDSGMSEEDLDFFYSTNYGFTMCANCLLPIAKGEKYCSAACQEANP